MSKVFNRLFFILLFIGIENIAISQEYWKRQTKNSVLLDSIEFFSDDSILDKEFYLPLPDSGFVPFIFTKASILPNSLKDKYQIFAYNGICSLDNETTATITFFDGKLYASIFFLDKRVNIMPENTNFYSVHWVEKQQSNHTCFSENNEVMPQNAALRLAALSTENQLKNYTIAISATAEYTNFHGGNIGTALAAIVTTLNRVNSIYNAELGINLVLHPKTDLLIYTSSTTDPYNNNNASTILDVAQSLFDNALGNNNYDLGHIFSTGAGGLADLATVCTKNKASGVTGTTSPIGDFYDVDFVCHEIGHQFGADHTFNGVKGNCAGNVGDARYEIGSGSTIMAYAGTCGEDNLQKNSDPYFHIKSIQEIRNYIFNGSGSTCGYYSGAINTAPQIQSQTANNYVIPISTPFILDGKATDANNDMLFYNWEQYDIGDQKELNFPAGNSPLFRSLVPSVDSYRYFPNLISIIDKTTFKGEILPTYERKMKFSFNARDQKGGVANQITSLDVTASAGPFTVLFPDGADTFLIGDKIKVHWDVANTFNAPVNCKDVMIILAENGITFSDTILLATPNDGAEIITLPSYEVTRAKIMVRSINNVFLAVSDGLFTIESPDYPYFTPEIQSSKYVQCGEEDSIALLLSAEVYTGFSDSVSYSITSSFGNTTIDEPNGKFDFDDAKRVLLKFNNSQDTLVKLTISFVSGAISHTVNKDIIFHKDKTPVAATNVFPLNGQENVSKTPLFVWEGNNNNKYIVSVFKGENLVKSSNLSTENQFQSGFLAKGEYTWQIETENGCGTSTSALYSFATGIDTCFSVLSKNTPMNMPLGTTDFYNKLSVLEDGILSSVEIYNLNGRHEWMTDLTFSLVSPKNESLLLFSDVCNGDSGEDYGLNIVDQSQYGFVPCAPKNGLNYRPNDSFSTLLGSNIKGDWILNIVDQYPDLDQGILDSWGLRFCVDKQSYIIGIPEVKLEPQEIKYSAYPNPSDGFVYISDFYKGNVKIINLLGQEILAQEYTDFISLQNLSKGIYLLKLDNGQLIKFEKS